VAPGDRQLVAYYVAPGVGAEAVQAYLAERLPAYMVPAAYVALDALPLTPNGKVDRRALPVPGVDAYRRRDYEAPLGGLEQAVAELWAQVLRVDVVGRWDDFFALGGHSLLAVQVIAPVAPTTPGQSKVVVGSYFTSTGWSFFKDSPSLARYVVTFFPPSIDSTVSPLMPITCVWLPSWQDMQAAVWNRGSVSLKPVAVTAIVLFSGVLMSHPYV
jgi:hypothetical protein